MKSTRIKKRTHAACVMATAILTVTVLARASAAASGLAEVRVFESGTEGYHTFRIPAILRATNGTLLAFAEGRKNSASDTGEIDLVLRRSFDNGRSWGPLQLVCKDGHNTVGNPAPVVDARSGKILLLTTRNAGNVSETQIRKGAVNDRRVFVQESMDNGATWSRPREITSQTKRANWRWYATGPGHGIQLELGPHAGRLIVPCDHTTNSAGPSAYGSHLIYSDDGGVTWRIGADGSPNNGAINPNECAAVELTDGRIYVVARDQNGTAPGNRAFAYSSDGGITFDTPFAIDARLVSPIVQASVLRCSAVDRGDSTNRILFAAPGDPSQRRKMTVRSSFDETRTWNRGKVIYAGPSAYSDMVKFSDGDIGLFYESGARNPYERITFTSFGTDFLDSAENAQAAPATLDSAVAWLEKRATEMIRNCRRTTRSGITTFPPQVGGGYEAFWLRDYAYMLEGDPSAFTDRELKDSCRFFLAGQRADGAMVDCIKFDGTPCYMPGYGTLGRNPVADGSQFMVDVAWQTFQKTRDTNLVTETLEALIKGMKAVPRNPATGLVHIGPGPEHDRCPYGFTDAIRKQGDVLFCSLLFVQAGKHLGDLLEAARRPQEAAYWRDQARQVTDKIREVFWDPGVGLFLAATVVCKQPDIWGSAFAVYLGVATPAQARAVARYFKDHYPEIVKRGQLRHLPANTYWEQTIGVKPETYQNGAYWATPVGWFVYALDPADSGLADQTVIDLVRDFIATGDENECVNDNYRNVSHYVASVALPLQGIRAMQDRREGQRRQGSLKRKTPARTRAK